MINQTLLYCGAALPLFWGVAHLFPTRQVIAGFGSISEDNKRILTMEWIIEGVGIFGMVSMDPFHFSIDGVADMRGTGGLYFDGHHGTGRMQNDILGG